MQGARSRDAIVPAPARWAHYPGFFEVQEAAQNQIGAGSRRQETRNVRERNFGQLTVRST